MVHVFGVRSPVIVNEPQSGPGLERNLNAGRVNSDRASREIAESAFGIVHRGGASASGSSCPPPARKPSQSARSPHGQTGHRQNDR